MAMGVDSRKKSLAEVLLNVGVGLSAGFLVNLIFTNVETAIAISAILTGISIIRGYFIRRLFLRINGKKWWVHI